ncbi:MAG: VWA domain-containing protein [Bacteroidaceae bacterium]|nr:VWA domain-containing protein [Bacteroidaceae bacterium]
MHFAHPAYFLLLLLILPMMCWHFLQKRKREPALRVATTEMSGKIPATARTALVHVPFVLRMLAVLLMVVALARPQTSHSLTESETEGINIMITMDVSVSMLTPDLQPNRIEAAKQVAFEFISGRPNDNIGLTLFGGEAFTGCPLTTHHASLLSMFRSVNCDLQQQGIISDGTAIGMGLTNAVARLAESDTVGQQQPARVVILLTDGANNTGEISPLTAAEIAKKNGVRVYTIAVGKSGKVRQPVAILPNGEYYYQTVESDMDPETLKKIAETTGGLFYHADSKKKLQEIYQDIDRLEKAKLKTRNYHKRYEAFSLFAWAALACLLLEFLLRKTWLRRIP